jgi:2-keto-4-pentenoate hydratase/2-oxohepta-3-ene-1,7-dioic acid hydratase in catechol pathway
MIFDVPALIESLSSTMTLRPGTVILTGTPAGVGFARTPPVWLKPGDRVRIQIAGIGTLENPVGRA